MRKITILFLLLFAATTLFAQRGKTGNLTVSTAVVVNEYTTLSANASAGNTSITVANSALNTNGRFAGNLASGDLIMIIQMQGATINGSKNVFDTLWGLPQDSTWGNILNYNNAGNVEFAEVSSVPNGTTIVLDCGLTNNYTASGNVQVIRVPRYNTLTINSPGSIGCDAWNGTTGGIVSIEVLGNTVINAGGSINVSNNGFRGGVIDSDSSNYGIQNTATAQTSFGKPKGEGIAGYNKMYNPYGGYYCKGAPANGGGGANAHNGGGGGGANGGVVANYINGYGNPDASTPNYVKAWNLEYTWMSAFTSAGGGRGGYTFSANNISPLTNKPNNPAWGGDQRNSQGGWGGRPLDYSTGKLFLAGGGGSGDQDNSYGGSGGNGAGMVYLMSYGTVSGTGSIIANGQNGYNAAGVAAFGKYAGQDGAGGAGAGGTVVVNSIGAISGITINANGGTGGNQVITTNFYFGTVAEAEGPGGGGSGGYIASSNLGLTETATGGANGTTNSPPMANFPPNGATKGAAGTTNATVTNFQIVANNDTICSGHSATLTATLTGTVPGGTTIEWYTTQTGGASVGSGATYITPVLAVTTTYYVGTCPGTYRQAVTVVVNGSAVTTISGPTTICKGANTTLTATGGTAYSWAPAASLNNPNIASPIATPTVTTTYTVSITTSCGVVKDSVTITVDPLPNVTFTGTTPICVGANTTVTATGGTTYLWNTGATTSSITVSPASTTTYTVAVGNGTCTKDSSFTVTVVAVPVPTITGTNTICAGASTVLTAGGGTSYLWNTGATTSTITVSPLTNTSYTVTVGNGTCTKDTNITVTVNPTPTVTVNPPAPTICPGGNVPLLASGATSYTWTPATNLTCTNCPNPTASPAATTTYTVVGANTFGCTDTTTVVVTVGGSLSATISGKDSICSGGNTTLTASGGTNYTWNTGATTSAITVSPASNTTYSVLVTSGTCKDSATVTVTVTAAPKPNITSPKTTLCAGDSTIITASGGTTYLWNTGATTSAVNVKPASTTSYTVTVGNGACTHDTTITITVNPVPNPTISLPQTICAGGNTVLTASGGTSYLWSNGATTSSITVSPAASSSYTVTVSNGTCSKDTTTAVAVNPTPVISLSGLTSICVGNVTTIKDTSTGAFTYSWSTGSTTNGITVSPTNDTSYTLQVTGPGPCTKDTTINVTVNAKPVPVVNKNDTVCAGTPVTLNASGGATYTWSPAGSLSANNISNPVATPATTTEYTVTVANGGCTAIDSVEVVVKPMPVGAAKGSTTITAGDSAVILATPGLFYVWSPSAGLSCTTCPDPTAAPTVTTTYVVTMTDSAGCSIEDSVLITVDVACGNIFIPTAFSPNNDGQNDMLYVRGKCIQAMELDIYDRWGNLIFKGTSQSEGWDGKYGGQPMNAGTYMYYLNALTTDGKNHTKKGSITLVR
jgi:gliding motility-associated-like protein